jgi:Uma2 family endonuclease
MTWQEVINHPSLQDLPFKIELNAAGVIEMSPATNWHGLLQGEILSKLNELLTSGRGSAEVSIQTTNGVRVADVAWAEKSFIHQYRDQTPYQIAPAICVEITSPSNTKKEMRQKIDLYLEAGATEVWLCNLEGELRFYNEDGQLEHSILAPAFPKEISL